MSITLSIVIVTYNAENSIKSCINSINSNFFTKIRNSYEIIIIDNASKDSTLKILHVLIPIDKTVRSSKNLGFSKACNVAAKKALGKYLLFLNPDTIVKPNTLQKVIKFAEKNNSYIIGCKILNSDNTLQPSCGYFPTIPNIIFDRIPLLNKTTRTLLIRNPEFYKSIQSVDWVTGAFLLVKRDVFLSLGGFDERYFMYGEDIDFCYRAKRAGHKIMYFPDAEIIHLDEGKLPHKKIFKAIQMRKGLSIFIEKYKPHWYFVIWKSILYIESIFKPYLRQIK